jgi:hypothetical protein
MCTEEQCCIYRLPPPPKSGMIRWAGNVAEMHTECLVKKPHRRLGDNIKVDIWKIGCEDWTV